MLGGTTEVDDLQELGEAVEELDGLSPDPDRGPRPREAWDERLIRGGGVE